MAWFNTFAGLLLDGSGATVLTNSLGSQRCEATIPGLGVSLSTGFDMSVVVDMGSLNNGKWLILMCGGAFGMEIRNVGGGNCDIFLEVNIGYVTSTIPVSSGPHTLRATYDGGSTWRLYFDGVLQLADTQPWVPYDDNIALQGDDYATTSDISLTALQLAV